MAQKTSRTSHWQRGPGRWMWRFKKSLPLNVSDFNLIKIADSCAIRCTDQCLFTAAWRMVRHQHVITLLLTLPHRWNHNNSCFSTVTQVVKKRVATHLNCRKHLPDIHQLHCYSTTIIRQINGTWTFATLQLKSPSQQNVGFIAVLTFALTMNNFLFFTSHVVAFFTHPDQKYTQLSGNWQQRKVSDSLQDTCRC